jgi:hypothetical protein
MCYEVQRLEKLFTCVGKEKSDQKVENWLLSRIDYLLIFWYLLMFSLHHFQALIFQFGVVEFRVRQDIEACVLYL